MHLDGLSLLGEEWNPAKRAVKPDPDPVWGAQRPQAFGDSTGVRLNGFFAFYVLPLPCGTSVVALNNPVTRASQSGGGGLSLEPGG
jgi:hypothetical protein